MSQASEKDLQKQADAALAAPPPAETKAQGQPAASGMLVGLSLSAAAIGSAFAFVTKTLTGMSRAQVLLGFLGAAFVVAAPVTIIAVIKLRQQDLSALLEGCGWAVNARMRFTRSQRNQFTRRAPFPEGATGTPRHPRIKLAVLLALLLALLAALSRAF
jgi:hypothetical protein